MKHNALVNFRYAFLEMNEIGLSCVITQLHPLKYQENLGRFEYVKQLHPNRQAVKEMTKIEKFIEENVSSQELKVKLAEKNPSDPTFMSAIQHLMVEIETQIEWDQLAIKPIVLVLVQQRETAKLMAEILKNSPGGL